MIQPTTLVLRPDQTALLSLLAAHHAEQINLAAPPGTLRVSVAPLDLLDAILAERAAEAGIDQAEVDAALAAAEAPPDIARCRRLVAQLERSGWQRRQIAEAVGLAPEWFGQILASKRRRWSVAKMDKLGDQLVALTPRIEPQPSEAP